MSKNRGEGNEFGRGDLAEGRDSFTEQASGHIRDHLRRTEDVVRALRKDLDYYRNQSSELIRERDGLSGVAGRIEQQERELAGLRDEVNFVVAERDRLAGLIGALQEENRRLAEHCANLEASLTGERRKREETQQTIVFLEAQIQEFESIAELLREYEAVAGDQVKPGE